MTELERLHELLKEREAVLYELQDAATAYAEKIAKAVPDGVAVEVDGYSIEPRSYTSTFTGGTYRTLAIKPAVSQCGWRALTNMGGVLMGSETTMPCDDNAIICVAGEDAFVFFAHNLERVVDAFEDELRAMAAKYNAAAVRLTESL